MCKQIYLPIDAKNEQPSLMDKNGTLPNYINELSQQFRASVATSYFCIVHGLVRIPELFYCTQSELEQLEHQIIDNTISPIVLISFRGNYHEYVCTSTQQPMESFPTDSVHSVPNIDDTAHEVDATIQNTDESVGQTVDESDVGVMSSLEADDSFHLATTNGEMKACTFVLDHSSQLQQPPQQDDSANTAL